MGKDIMQSNKGVEIHKGVFSAPSFTTIGDPYMKKLKTDARLSGKNFKTQPVLQGRWPSGQESVYFEKEHKWMFKGKKYMDTMPEQYRLTQPREQRAGKGKELIAFLSTAPNKRGEFSNNIRCGQYDQQIAKETSSMRTAKPSTYDQSSALMPDHTREFMKGKLETDSEDVKSGPDKLYDIGRSANTQFQPSQHRDMFYSGKHVSETKRLGPARFHSSSLKVGWGHLEATKFKEISEFASIPIIRSTFYRRTGCPGLGRPGQPAGTNTFSAGSL
eukprot:TRINITY_DN1390_c0_g2_i3.p1 TRINITY_DN1390_c0_g2~~TRINITY_DN1390_c0_g2_i3.p1  ORF type:complete len:274 (-),score=44.87 TRINITY_DN1390_c0_g2_i3:927-1748(-)